MTSSYTLSDVMASTVTPQGPDVLSVHDSNGSSMEGVTTDNMTLSSTLGSELERRRYGPLEDFPQFWVAWYINQYYLSIITAIGFPGNILSFITILKMKPHSHPSIYVAVLAISDNCCLASKILFLELTRHDVDVGSFGCKFLFFAGTTTAMYANWLLVLMTVERFLAIWFPLKVGALCTRRRSAVAMGFLLVLVAALCSALFEITSHSWVDDDFICIYRDDYYVFVNYVWYWVDGTFYALLPCIFLTVFNILIIVGIKRAALIQRQLTEDADSSFRHKHTSGQAVEKVRQQRQITIMLVIVCVVFVLLIMPNCIFFIYKPYWNPEPLTEDYADYKCTEQIVFLLSDLSHAINFFVYFISTKKFRDRFLDTMCCCRKLKRRLSRASHVGQSQFSETGSIYITSTSNGGVLPMSLRNSGRY